MRSKLDGKLVHSRVIASIEFSGTHSYTWVVRGTVRVKSFAQEYNTVSSVRGRNRSSRSGAESSALTMRPPCLTVVINCKGELSSPIISFLLNLRAWVYVGYNQSSSSKRLSLNASILNIITNLFLFAFGD